MYEDSDNTLPDDYEPPIILTELAEALGEYILPIFNRHGFSDPYMYVEETIEGPNDGLIIVHVASVGGDPLEEDNEPHE